MQPKLRRKTTTVAVKPTPEDADASNEDRVSIADRCRMPRAYAGTLMFSKGSGCKNPFLATATIS
jgi:hypothetical protein